jgi:hypothetical protein
MTNQNVRLEQNDLLGKKFTYDHSTFTVIAVEDGRVTLVDHEQRERKLTARQLRDGLSRGVLKADS